MGRVHPLAPFLARPRYSPLPRPHDAPRVGLIPSPPASLPGVAECPRIVRVCQRLGISLARMDAKMTVDEVLDEMDLQSYLYDLDTPPAAAPLPKGRR